MVQSYEKTIVADVAVCGCESVGVNAESCKTNGTIVYSASEKDAVEELKLSPEQTTGADFPIMKKCAVKGAAVPFTINEGVRTCYHGITG